MCALHEMLSGLPLNQAGIAHLIFGTWTHKLKHFGEQSVPKKLHDERKQWTHHECGQVLCPKGNDATHVHDTWSLVARSWRDGGQRSKPLERWIKPGSVLAPVQSGSSGSASEPPGHRATVPQRADAEILVDAHAPRADEEHMAPEILPEASQPSPP